MVFSSNALVCLHCHLKLDIDRMKSGKAIEALKKVQAAQDALSRKLVLYSIKIKAATLW